MAQDDSMGRETLPIPHRHPAGSVTYDAKDPATTFPPIEPLRPPAGAPNVLVVLLDDVGFGASSAFGGPVSTPTAERLAAGGLKYNRFHTTALCAPTRQALLTGRNHHAVGMGVLTELATSAPGYSSVRPNTCAPLAQILKLNGYSTAQFGKCHEVPVWESSPMGPFDAWPTGGGGFEHFYGFIGAETNGIGCARKSSPGRSSWGSFPPTLSSPPARPRSRAGMTWRTSSSRCWPARWRSTPGSWSTPTTTSAGSSTPWPTWRSSTTRWST